MESFKASPQAAQLIIASRWNPPNMPPQITVTSRRARLPGEGVDLALVQEAIGERLLRLLGTLARQSIAKNPGTSRLRIMKAGSFEEYVEAGLRARLGLADSSGHYQEALRALARDFFDWVRVSAVKQREYGFEYEPDSGDVFVASPDLTPRISPLE